MGNRLYLIKRENNPKALPESFWYTRPMSVSLAYTQSKAYVILNTLWTSFRFISQIESRSGRC